MDSQDLGSGTGTSRGAGTYPASPAQGRTKTGSWRVLEGTGPGGWETLALTTARGCRSYTSSSNARASSSPGGHLPTVLVKVARRQRMLCDPDVLEGLARSLCRTRSRVGQDGPSPEPEGDAVGPKSTEKLGAWGVCLARRSAELCGEHLRSSVYNPIKCATVYGHLGGSVT